MGLRVRVSRPLIEKRVHLISNLLLFSASNTMAFTILPGPCMAVLVITGSILSVFSCVFLCLPSYGDLEHMASTAENDESICAICLEEVQQYPVLVNCEHRFHMQCISGLNKHVCPLCRRDLLICV